MKLRYILLVLGLIGSLALAAEEPKKRYVEVTGTAEIEIVPDRIHYLIEVCEYFEEEFDGVSKPEQYRTKVPLSIIEKGLRQALDQAGIAPEAVRTQEVGDYWRQQGKDFLVSKLFDVTLTDFRQIDQLVKLIDTRGIRSMRIGELENKDMQKYHEEGKIEALKAAKRKASYLVEAMDQSLGDVLRIVEIDAGNTFLSPQSNVVASEAREFDNFRTIKKKYAVKVRFEITYPSVFRRRR